MARYRVIKEGTRTYDDVTKDYKKFLPKEVNKKHWIFVKKPILKSLTKLQRAVYDPSYVKEAYLKQFHMMAPNYLAEEYGDVLYKFEGSFYNVVLHVMPFHDEQPGLRVYLDHKKEWIYLCSIEELCYMTAGNDGTLDISRKNGIPVYLKFMSLPQMFSFIGCCDGYYRLMVKSTFNICKIVPTPSLQRLHLMKCHGPVGGEFSYHKLIEKRGYKPGCYILRQCEQYYDVYYVDVFTKNSTKPETYKIEKCDGMYAFKEDAKNQHSSIAKLLSSYNNAEKRIFLQECLPPSEYDKSPLLLCGEYHRSIPSRIDNEEDLETLLSQNKNRRIISPDDLLLFKGQHSKSMSGDKCRKWNKSWNRRKIKTATGQIVKGEVFEDKRFPDPGRKYADRYCRNPDGDPGGPWCFVETDESDDIYEKEYCDIPFCDYQPCEVFTGESSNLYTHYVSFDSSITNLTFALKMWSPDDVVEGIATIALTVLSVPATRENIEDWAMGLEVTISCDGIGLTIGNNHTDIKKRPNLLKVDAYTEFWVSWSDGELLIGMQNTALPIFKFPFQMRKLMSVLPLRYYSLKGKNLMWNAPFCDIEECPLHTTSSLDYAVHWPMKKNSPSYDVEFSLKAVRFAHLKLVSSPATQYPRLVILLSSFNNFTKVVYEGSISSSDHVVLAEVLLRNLLNYHNWITFTLTVFGSEVQVHRVHEYGTHLVIKATHSFLKTTRWFSCGSQGVIAHWSFFCKPPAVETAMLPECVLTDTDKDYKGTQWVTSAGAPCIPWIAKTVLESKHDTSFIDERIAAVNYCRNIKNGGPSCLIMNKKNKVIMSSCHVRLCTAVDCKMAGTADGYMGALSITRSNLTCKDWLSVPENIFRKRYRNITLYADDDISEIKNYCRNPTRSIAGPWCYTTHPNISIDYCDVRDCDLTEEQIVIMKPKESKRFMYILPEWKFNGSSGGLYFSLKLWNPDFMGGMGFSIYSKDLSEKYVLSIGAEENEKLVLEYGNDDSLKLLSSLEYPRIVPTGKWVNLWLQVNRNGIRLGYQGMEDEFFSWEPSPKDSGFDPTYMTFYTLEFNNIIGIHFTKPQCKTEMTSANAYDHLHSLGYCADNDNKYQKKFTVYIRGNGRVHLTLILEPGIYQYEVMLTRFLDLYDRYLGIVAEYESQEQLLNNSTWTRFDVEREGNVMRIYRNTELLVEYNSEFRPILFYWFAVRVFGGLVYWTANCDPPDLDAAPLDGGWSDWEEWQCSVSCGGGVGIRRRYCDSPKPNLFGSLCYGPAVDNGRCNEFECGDISPESIELIRYNLERENINITSKEFTVVSIPIPIDLVERIIHESPKAAFIWTHNGLTFSVNETSILETFTLRINNVRWKDSGVYICFVERVNGERLPFIVAAVSVSSKTADGRVYLHEPFKIPCNCIYLAYLYTDLTLMIFLNDKMYKDFGVTALSIHESYDIESATKNLSGIWRFQIEHAYLGLRWVTNVYKLKVLPSNLFTYLREDEVTSPIFGKIQSDAILTTVLIAIILFLIIMGILCTWFSLRVIKKTPLFSKDKDVSKESKEVTLREVRALMRKKCEETGEDFLDTDTHHISKYDPSILKNIDAVKLKKGFFKSTERILTEDLTQFKSDDKDTIARSETDYKSLITDDETLEANIVKSGTRVDGEKGLTVMYKAEWKVAKGKKMEVAMKLIKQDACDKYKVEFNDLAGRWADLSSSAIVKLHGITLRSTTSMIMEYMRYGPLDVYLRDKCSEIVLVDLVEAAASLATALWHLAEAGIVHGDIRCRKMLVANHTDERFQVKLSDPGLHLSYAPEDVHWLPIECFSNPELAKKSASADVWAFATTLWEIFSYGDSPARINPTLTEKSYLQGHRLCIPKGCPPEMWSLVQSAWMADPHRRATPHTLMRDINHIFYQVFNSRRTHSYATVYPKSFKESSITTGSASSLGRFSNGTTESCLEAVLSVSDAERDSLHSISSTFSGGSTRTATTDQDNFHENETMSCDISTILSNLQFSSMNSTNSLDPGSLFQCKFELDANCNLVLQGRIGQGFYGEVFRGTLETDGESEPRSVAVKKLKTTALSQMQDFEREIAIMKKLKHRNIVEILGVIEEPEIQLIMEYIWHGSLQSYLKIHRHAVTVKHLVGYALDVALGMDYLGTKHVVHRDLAARNILVVAEDHVKISDFGLAQVMSKGDYYIFKTNRDLPLKWYAPESVSDGKYSSRSDVWSYGVTLWEMFSYGEEPPSWGPNALIENTLIANSDSSSHLLSASSVPDMEKASKLCCPAACPSEVYARLLLPCWNLTPHQRPTFKQLASVCKEIAATLI